MRPSSRPSPPRSAARTTLVEIADVGPFFEDDLQVAGKSRLIRAREGIRPMIKVEFGDNETVKGQVAKFLLGNGRVDHLVFEGIDFAVNVRDLPEHQACLFLCQGADLTFRNCSLTVLNASDMARPTRFSMIRVEDGPAANRIVFERSLIRGPVGTLLDLVAGRAEVVFSRSMVLGDNAALIHAEAVDKPARSFFFERSVFATRGSILDFAARSSPIAVRSLGTIFAKVEGGTNPSAGMFASRSAIAAEPAASVDWAGEDNDFIGWPALLTDSSARVAGLDAIKSSWPGSDGSSRESATPWQAHNRPDEARAVDFAELARRGSRPSSRSPSPTPGSATRPSARSPGSPRPSFPPTSCRSRSSGPDPAGWITSSARRPSRSPCRPRSRERPALGRRTGSGPRPARLPRRGRRIPRSTGRAGGATASARPAQAHLRRPRVALARRSWALPPGKLVPGTPQATVMIRGTGVFATTPIKFADGLSIAILGDPAQPLVTFKPKLSLAGRTMFELHGGDLALANIGFSSDGPIRPGHWVLAEDSILAIKHCWFRDQTVGGASAGVAPLIAFVAKGTAPIPKRSGPLASETDRPTARLKDSLLWTDRRGDHGGGRPRGRRPGQLHDHQRRAGLHAPAGRRQPRPVRGRPRLELLHDRDRQDERRARSLAGRAGRTVPPLAGLDPSLRIPRSQPPGGAGALLQVDADAMARGVLFWQSSYDAYDSLHLLVATGPQVANPPSTEVKKQWIDIWGVEHTKGDQGPTARRNETVIRYMDREKVKPGKVTPSAIDVDKSVIDAASFSRNCRRRSRPGCRRRRPPRRGPSAPGPTGISPTVGWVESAAARRYDGGLDWSSRPIPIRTVLEDEPPWSPPRISSAGWSSRSTAHRT